MREEIKTGERVNGKFHSIKAEVYMNSLKRVLRTQGVSADDKAIAQALLDEFLKILNGRWQYDK
ncbi:MAG: hypothetical protein ACRCUP_00030 [Mycoplasmatales bacterium]